MLIIAEKVLTMGRRKTPNANAIVIRGTRIAAVGHSSSLKKRFPRDRTLDLGPAVLMPGLVNTHAHLELPVLTGINASGYAQWVLNLLRAKRGLRRHDYRRAAERNVQALVATGTTTVGEICTHGASPSAIRRGGIRAVVYHELIAMAPGILPAIPRGLSSSGLIVHGLSPHSAHTVSEAVLGFIGAEARKRELTLCMHVAESADEGLLLRGRKSGLDRIFHTAGWQRDWAPQARSSVAYLDRLKVLSKRFLAVHAVHIDAADIELLKRSGSSVAHCPRSNNALRVGTLRLRRLLDAGITVGLGTDSLASVPSLSLWDEMRFAYREHRPAGISARDILSLATTGGAAALGMSREIGTLEPGKKADIIALPPPRRRTGDLYSDLLRETKNSTMTMVNGAILHRAAAHRR